MAYTQDQYLGFAQQLAPYLSDPTQLMQQAGKLGLGVEERCFTLSERPYAKEQYLCPYRRFDPRE